jgi:SagB-type dehydrogenase family enzyme
VAHEEALPRPRATGPLSVEEAIRRRRSVRAFAADRVDLMQVSQILWAAQGETGAEGLRAAPSAGALYPLEVFVVAGAVDCLAAGVYRFVPQRCVLREVRTGDRRSALAHATLEQGWISDAPAVVVLAAVFARTMRKYGERGRRYVHMEVGHAAQNIYLQAEALGLGSTIVGAFLDEKVAEVVGMEPDEEPLGILPVGVAR